jgi:hypothetical protein
MCATDAAQRGSQYGGLVQMHWAIDKWCYLALSPNPNVDANGH